MPSLEERRVREDLIEAFNLLKGIAKLEYSLLFKLSGDSKVRGHTYKIVKNSFRLDSFRGCDAKEDADLDTEENVLRPVPSIDIR